MSWKIGPLAAITAIQIFAQAVDILPRNYDLAVEISGESFLTPPGQLSDLIASAVKKVTGLTPELSTTGGTSDARFIKNACPVAEFGLVGQSMHKADERVTVADLDSLTEIYHSVLQDFFGMPC